MLVFELISCAHTDGGEGGGGGDGGVGGGEGSGGGGDGGGGGGGEGGGGGGAFEARVCAMPRWAQAGLEEEVRLLLITF